MPCPRCGQNQTRKGGQNKGRQIYRCKICGTQFISQGKQRDPIGNSLVLTKDYLVNAYQLQGMTTTEIATETGISSRTVNYYLHRHKIPVRQGARLYRAVQNVEGFLVPSTDWHAKLDWLYCC